MLTYADVCWQVRELFLSALPAALEYIRAEQLSGKEYGHEVDWWALGVLVWEMITGMLTYADVC